MIWLLIFFCKNTKVFFPPWFNPTLFVSPTPDTDTSLVLPGIFCCSIVYKYCKHGVWCLPPLSPLPPDCNPKWLYIVRTCSVDVIVYFKDIVSCSTYLAHLVKKVVFCYTAVSQFLYPPPTWRVFVSSLLLLQTTAVFFYTCEYMPVYVRTCLHR